MIVSKEFSNSFGRPIQLTRAQFKTKWVGHMCQAYDIFLDAGMGDIFTDVIMPNVEQAAGIAWDVHTLQGAKVE